MSISIPQRPRPKHPFFSWISFQTLMASSTWAFGKRDSLQEEQATAEKVIA